MSDNPLLTASTLPHQFPRFDLIQEAHYLPAFVQGMAEQLAEVDAIARQPAPATFENTIVALEKSGQLLARVAPIFDNLASAHTNAAMQQIESELAPQLAAHRDAIRLHPALFARIRTLYAARTTLGLDAESARLLERYYLDYTRAGALLPAAAQEKLKAINTELATLHTTFTQNVLKEKNADAVLVVTREELAGLSANEITTAAAAAQAAGHEGHYLLALLNTSGQPALASLTHRPTREKLMAASLARGSHGGPRDNRALIARLALLRAQRAALLGYPSHAAYQLADQTAKTVDKVNRLLTDLARPAVVNARREAADIQAIIDAGPERFPVAACDWELYSEKVRTARYAFDEAQLRPYFEINRVLIDGIFFAATRLYGLTFKARTDLPRYHPDLQIFEVFNEDGSHLALFVIDWYARPSKRGGAWMNEYVSQSHLLGTTPVIGNQLNVPKPPAGEPTLLTWDEVTTAFHEFGHALHGMFSNVRYPRFAGTSVPTDFVEFPSQVTEMWADWPAVLENYAKHHQTGALIPPALLAKVQAAEKFNQGYTTTEYLAAALLDQSWHQLAAAAVPAADGVLAFEAAALKKAGVDFAPVPPRYRSAYFSHVFSSNDYAAGYYSYIWSEVLDADSVEWFKQHGGLTRANGDRLRTHVLSRGGSADAMELYRAFRGGEPELRPLLVRRGLETPAAE
ncbi:MAG: M3 family metallopeptidase [Opitutaceae bacterium]|nr:M3 family metallopeptidase [Opitutaceae bacterium]